jgi:hypothetical protein
MHDYSSLVICAAKAGFAASLDLEVCSDRPPHPSLPHVKKERRGQRARAFQNMFCTSSSPTDVSLERQNTFVNAQ